MTATPTSLDFVASIFVLIIVVISGFTLLGTGVLMAIGAVFSNRPLVTSWPGDQEHSFAPFERRGASSNALAWVVSILGAAAVAVVAAGIYFGVAPDKHDVSKDMNMSNLTKRRTPLAAPKPDAPATAPGEAPKAEAPAAAPGETPKTETPKAEAPAAEAPKP